MVVDDDEPSLRLYSAVVRRVLGEDALAFENPLAALAYLNEQTPSLIVVDYRMPDMDGLDFIHEVRSRPKHVNTPILFLTGDASASIGPDAIAAGATLFLEKPFSLRDFSAHLRHFLGTARSIRGEVVMPTDERDTILRLHKAIQACSTDLAWHAVRVRDLAVLIAEKLHCNGEMVEAIRMGGLVYDIGMISVPEKVRELPSVLPMRWRSLVNAHVDAGATILGGGRRPLLRMAAEMARSHHERFDGQGYPDGLYGTQIPIAARIIAVADTYIALMGERPHRVEYEFSHALSQIESEKGKAFDPDVVEAFLSLGEQLRDFPRSA